VPATITKRAPKEEALHPIDRVAEDAVARSTLLLVGVVVFANCADGSGGGSLPSQGGLDLTISICGELATEYYFAQPSARICEPSNGPCAVLYPSVEINGGPGPIAQDLCWADNYLDGSHAAGLNTIISQYMREGCQVRYCTSLGRKSVPCLKGNSGTYTCGGD